MTTAADVMDGVFAAVRDRTDAGATIARPGDLPFQPGQYPRWRLRVVAESKQSLGRGSIAFNTIVTIRLIGEVSEPVEIDDDVAVTAIDVQLQMMKQQAERAIINSSPLFGLVQQLVSVQTQYAYKAQATHLAGIQQDYAFEIFQSAEDFAPLETEDLTEITGTLSDNPDTGFGVQYG